LLHLGAQDGCIDVAALLKMGKKEACCLGKA
jgi:hypothetical protein